MSKSLPLIFCLWVVGSAAFGMPSFVKKHFGEDDSAEYIVGKITKVEPVDPYVYLQVKTEGTERTVWVATSIFGATEGLRVRFRPSQLAKVFKSPKTGKVYKDLYMVKDIEVQRANTASDDCFLVKAFADGDKVELAGLVTKVNTGILGKNWVHVQDEQNRCLSLDLTVTTQDEPKVGDLIKATGTIRFDQNIGGAYHFPILIEDAKIKVQNPRN